MCICVACILSKKNFSGRVKQATKKIYSKKNRSVIAIRKRLKQKAGEFWTLEGAIGRVQGVYKVAYLSSFTQHCFE